MTRTVGALLLTATLTACGGGGGGAAPNPAPAPDASGQPLPALVTAINDARRANGLPDLTLNARLNAAAAAHAGDMARRGYFAHDTPEGQTVADRVTAQGYTWCFVAENLAYGQSSVAETVAGWQTSPGHRANNLSPKAVQAGAGKAIGNGRTYWVAVFARGC